MKYFFIANSFKTRLKLKFRENLIFVLKIKAKNI